MTPTARSMKLLREEGRTVVRVEHYHYFARVRMDLWGFDLLWLKGHELGFVQVTTADNAAARIKKLIELPTTMSIAFHNVVEVHSWAQRGPRGKRKLWTCQRRRLVLQNGKVVECPLLTSS